jgi:hypothetical protein
MRPWSSNLETMKMLLSDEAKKALNLEECAVIRYDESLAHPDKKSDEATL